MRTEYSAKTTAYRVCAWCGFLLGVKSWPSVWDDATITHGVCEPCMRRLLNRTHESPAVEGGSRTDRVDPAEQAHGVHGTEYSELARLC